MGPSYDSLFVGYVEHQFFNQYDGPKPDLYGRYIDDCIGAISSNFCVSLRFPSDAAPQVLQKLTPFANLWNVVHKKE